MPTHDGLGPDDGYGAKNSRAATIEPDEQSAVGPTQRQSAWRALLQAIELLPHHKDFGCQQLLITFSFALKPLNVPNFGSGVVSLDLPVALCNALVFEDHPRRFAHGHQYTVVWNRPLGGSIRLIQTYGYAGPSGEELIQ